MIRILIARMVSKMMLIEGVILTNLSVKFLKEGAKSGGSDAGFVIIEEKLKFPIGTTQ